MLKELLKIELMNFSILRTRLLWFVIQVKGKCLKKKWYMINIAYSIYLVKAFAYLIYKFDDNFV